MRAFEILSFDKSLSQETEARKNVLNEIIKQDFTNIHSERIPAIIEFASEFKTDIKLMIDFKTKLLDAKIPCKFSKKKYVTQIGTFP